MSEIKEGSIVKCAFCQKEVEVQFIGEHDGMKAYNLTCFHRNALCPTCGQMARDESETIKEVHVHCVTCDGPLYDDDDD
ncbi:MAG: hypothetical protein R2747_18955 [Pyrinomonadaceae bacterium]